MPDTTRASSHIIPYDHKKLSYEWFVKYCTFISRRIIAAGSWTVLSKAFWQSISRVGPWCQSDVSGSGRSSWAARSPLNWSISSWRLCSISSSASCLSTSIFCSLRIFLGYFSSRYFSSSRSLSSIRWHSSDFFTGMWWSSGSRRDPRSTSHESLLGPLSSQEFLFPVTNITTWFTTSCTTTPSVPITTTISVINLTSSPVLRFLFSSYCASPHLIWGTICLCSDRYLGPCPGYNQCWSKALGPSLIDLQSWSKDLGPYHLSISKDLRPYPVCHPFQSKPLCLLPSCWLELGSPHMRESH